MKINKSKFIEELAAVLSITQSESERYLNAAIHLIYINLKQGNSVNMSGFGQFSVSYREARLGVDPRSLKQITIPALVTPKFKAGEGFKDAIK